MRPFPSPCTLLWLESLAGAAAGEMGGSRGGCFVLTSCGLTLRRVLREGKGKGREVCLCGLSTVLVVYDNTSRGEEVFCGFFGSEVLVPPQLIVSVGERREHHTIIRYQGVVF